MDLNLQNEIESIISSGKNFLIAIDKNAAIDSIAASLALSQTLQEKGKSVTVACVTPLTVEASILFGVDKVETKVGNKNLIISLDYIEGSIEKVSYNVEGNKFNLVVQPKSGFPPFSTEKVHYSHSGLSADAIFVIGSGKLEDLGSIYEENKDNFIALPIINIDTKKENTKFGKINLIDLTTSSCSELIVELIKGLNLSLDIDIASNLLSGIESATNSFQSPNTTAKDFEAAAYCMNLGAKRLYKLTPHDSNNVIHTNISQEQPIKKEEPELVKPQEKVKPPPDWLQPKIYRGGQLL